MMGWILRSRERLFWLFQILIWGSYMAVRLLQGFTQSGQISPFFDTALVAAVTGLTLSTVMRYLYQPLQGRVRLPVLALIALGVSALFAFLFSAIEILALRLSDPVRAGDYNLFENFMLEGFVLLSWSAVYLGSKLYQQLVAQREATLRATAMAHEAQLAMLRYQLNPHFLFNTLNAISTLVLDKDVACANEMVSKLSAFLRYSLVNQPTQKVSLDQELHALGLYLDIEKVRFGERLAIRFDVEARCRQALIPSLLLQPMIENAVKYAVAPSEDGGTIAIAARADGDWLALSVRDDGPGLDGPVPSVPAQTSSGVGIANTRARLQEIYGQRHSFGLVPAQPSGLDVQIRIPLEYKTGAPATPLQGQAA